MATNPRIPEQFTPPEERTRPEPEVPLSPAPGVILAIIVALLLLGAIFYFMPRTQPQPSGGTGTPVSSQPLPGDVQIGHSAMSIDPTGRSLTVDANVRNIGQNRITGVAAELTFRTSNGGAATVNGKVMGLIGADAPGRAGSTQDLATAPLKPGETRAVRIAVGGIPAGWNHQMPSIRIITVTAN